jgi:hypothetical protein
VPFDVETVGNITPSTVCGMPAIEIVTSRGSPNIDAIFTPDYENGVILVGPTSEANKAGNYYLRYKYFNSNAPERFAVSPVFKLVVKDACNPPMQMISPTVEPLRYVIGSPKVSHPVPAWTTEPSHCASQIPV